jgi:hypothetical protein
MTETNTAIVPPSNAGDLSLQGVVLESLDSAACAPYIAWMLTPSSPLPSGLPQRKYHAVLQCSDSLVWGIGDENGWQWASDADKAIRAPCCKNLLEARIFREDMEILIWRDEPFSSAQFRGRIAQESACSDEYRPLERFYCFAGKEKSASSLPSTFVKREEPGGNTTVTPEGAGVSIRAYLQPDADTGLLRVALTRFVSILPHVPASPNSKES